MSQLAPPDVPPLVTMDDGDRLRRVRTHLRQLILAAITVVVTGWFCTLGPLPAIFALMIAKHVLVAILAMGLGLDVEGPRHSDS